MSDRDVHRSGKDSDGDITKLCDGGGGWGSVGKWEAIRDIESKRHTYYVPWRVAGRTEIRVVIDASVAGGKYLRTDRDQTKRNNLDDLPNC